MIDNIVYEQDLHDFLDIKPAKLKDFGDYLAQKFSLVQIIGQIEPEKGVETYHVLKNYLGKMISNQKPNGFNLISLSQNHLYFAYVLALYAVWTSIYQEYSENTDSYWDKFYTNLPLVKRSATDGRYNKMVGDAVKKVIQSSSNLEPFFQDKKDLYAETSWVHVNQILLHGLPQSHIRRFVEKCVFSETDHILSEELQCKTWLRQLEQPPPLFQSTLQRFFRRGGDIALAFTHSFQVLREAWNEDGRILPHSGLPSYMHQIFCEEAQKKPPQKQKKSNLKIQEKIPSLCLELERYMQPFLVIHPRQVSQTGFIVTITSNDPNYKSSITLQTYLHGSIRYSRETHPELEPNLLVPPAQFYQVTFSKNNHKSNELDISLPNPQALIFDALSGKLCNLNKDIRWPERLLLVMPKTGSVETDGDVNEPIPLQGSWQNWHCFMINQPTSLKLYVQNQLIDTFTARKSRQQLKLQFINKTPVNYWVHVSESLLLVTDLTHFGISCSGMTSAQAVLNLLSPHKSFPLFQSLISENQIIHLTEIDPAPGMYTIQLRDKLQKIYQDILYLPNANFSRSPDDCRTAMANEISFQLPRVNWKLIQRDSKMEALEERGKLIKLDEGACVLNPTLPAIGIEVFPETADSSILYLITQDIRWRRYGHAKMPHIRQMLTQKEFIPLHKLESLTDTRLRVEVEFPVFEQLYSIKGEKVLVEVRDSKNKVLVPGKQSINYRSNAYWDLDMLLFVKEALSLTKDRFVSIGFQLERQFFPLIEVALTLELKNMKIVSLGFKNDKEQFQLTWIHQEENPKKFNFRLYSKNQAKSGITIKSNEFGSIIFDLPISGEFLKWDLYVERINSNNPFASFGAYEPEKTSFTFTQYPSQLNQISPKLKTVALEFRNQQWYEHFEIDINNLTEQELKFLEIRIFKKENNENLNYESQVFLTALPAKHELKFCLPITSVPEVLNLELWVCINGENKYFNQYEATRKALIVNLNNIHENYLNFDDLNIQEENISEVLEQIYTLLEQLKTNDYSKILNCLKQLSGLGINFKSILIDKLNKELPLPIFKLIIASLVLVNHSDYIPILIKLLTHELAEKRYIAAFGLIKNNSPEISQNLIRIYNEKKYNTKLLEILPIIIKNMNGEFDFKDIMTLLNDNNEDIRNAAYYKLCQMKSTNNIHLLIDLVKSSEKQTLRKIAISALGDLKAENAIQSLLDVYQEPDFKDIAANALIKIGNTDPDINNLYLSTINNLIENLDHNIERHTTYENLEFRYLNSLTLQERLINTLQKSQSWSQRSGAAFVLGKLEIASSAEILLNLLKNSTQLNEQIIATKALGYLNYDKALNELSHATQSPNSPLKNPAQKSIEKLKIKQFSQTIFLKMNQLVLDLSHKNRSISSDGLEKIEENIEIEKPIQNQSHIATKEILSEQEIDAIIQKLNGNNDNLIIEAASSLGQNNIRQSIPYLQKILIKNSYSQVKIAVMKALLDLNANEALNDIILQLNNNLFEVKSEAVKIICKFNSSLAFQAIIHQFTAELNKSKKQINHKYLIELAKALSSFPCQELVDVLEQAINNPKVHKIYKYTFHSILDNVLEEINRNKFEIDTLQKPKLIC
ncbi:MAG: HEAT repeat domain-containing protein [Candidatus Sericytochromatia bacterium]|nr:HEAT repeat domain-containing protein [Candidatus Sericytochromatia bacterium]